jgi:hypothetical protein
VAPIPLPAAHEVSVLAPAGLNSLNSGTPEKKSVIDQLMANLHDPASDLRNTHVLIESNVSPKTAESLIRRENLELKLFHDVESKQLFSYELNGNEQHEIVLGEISAQIRNYAHTAGLANRLVIGHGLRQFGARGRINPDQGLQLRNPAAWNAQMYRLIVEVGFTESLQSLHGHAVNFFAQNSGQVYVFVRIYGRRANQTRAMVHRNQAHPVSFLSCGDAPLHFTFLQYCTAQFPGVVLPVINKMVFRLLLPTFLEKSSIRLCIQCCLLCS